MPGSRDQRGTWQPLSNTSTLAYTEQNGALPFQVTGSFQSIDPSDGFYTYLEQNFINQWLMVTDHVLARWNTSQQMEGLWEIKIEANLPDGTIVPAGSFLCPQDGTQRSSVVVDLDQQAPSASIALPSYSRGGGQPQPPGNCGTYEVGDLLYGTYATVSPESHFASFSLQVLPSGNVVNSSGSVSANGASGNWWPDTAHMQPCGYVLFMQVSNRTIVNSGSVGWPNNTSIGFCLTPAPGLPSVP